MIPLFFYSLQVRLELSVKGNNPLLLVICQLEAPLEVGNPHRNQFKQQNWEKNNGRFSETLVTDRNPYLFSSVFKVVSQLVFHRVYLLSLLQCFFHLSMDTSPLFSVCLLWNLLNRASILLKEFSLSLTLQKANKLNLGGLRLLDSHFSSKKGGHIP